MACRWDRLEPNDVEQMPKQNKVQRACWKVSRGPEAGPIVCKPPGSFAQEFEKATDQERWLRFCLSLSKPTARMITMPMMISCT